jgi:hypothetical protein
MENYSGLIAAFIVVVGSVVLINFIDKIKIKMSAALASYYTIASVLICIYLLMRVGNPIIKILEWYDYLIIGIFA